jgi:hypothetical protein
VKTGTVESGAGKDGASGLEQVRPGSRRSSRVGTGADATGPRLSQLHR